MKSDKLIVGAFGEDVTKLQENLKKYGFTISAEEVKRQYYGPSTREAVGEFQKAHGIDPSCEVCEKTAAVLALHTNPLRNIELLSEPMSNPVQGRKTDGTSSSPSRSINQSIMDQRIVKGSIALEYGVPAVKLKLRLYQRGFGGIQTLLKEVETDENGKYEISYDANGMANIEMHAVGLDGKEMQLSQTKFSTAQLEKLDLIAPTKIQPPEPEFARLNTAISVHLPKPEALKNAIELGNRRDISLLAASTNWDGRALVLASLAYQHADSTRIPADALYALYRAGLPTKPTMLAKIDPQSVETILGQAVQSGIIHGDVLQAGKSAFKEFVEIERLNFIAPGKLSSLSEFVIRASVLEEDRVKFTSVLKEGKGENLWSRAKQAGVTEQGIATLKLQGKLAYLTLNNAELTTFLMAKLGTGDVLQLIDLDFDQTSTWNREISTLAGGVDAHLRSLIPPAFVGLNNQERLEAYCDELARRVRQMDANRVTMRQLQRGDLDGIPSEARMGIQAFLNSATNKGFRLGQTAMSSFIAEHGEDSLFPGITAIERKVALDEVKSIHRLYSVSSSDKALNVLRKKGITSAHDITNMPYLDFLTLVGTEIGSTRETSLIYWKAQQQSATVFNVFSGAKRLDVSPPMDSLSGKKAKRDVQIARAKEKLVGRYPTLEALFGNVDFCECEHCKSVLSPAAYLVDILHFIDPKEPQWSFQKAQWKATQSDQMTDYEPTHKKPFDALMARRPDIPNIALTCANTNTAMPYIDIVNEILELLVTNGYSGIKAFDTGTASSKDLIAEPQNITWEAYVGNATKPGLNTLVYPTTLPFDLPLEMVRAFLKQLDMPLWKLRQLIGRPTQLEGTVGNADGLIDIWFEQLGLGPADINVLVGKYAWYELYGYSDELTALAELENAQTLSRRLGVTYKELVELFKTEFVNPTLSNLIILQKLDVDPHDVERYFNPTAQNALTPGEQSALEAHLNALKLTPEDIRSLWSDNTRENLLLLHSPEGGSDFSKTTVGFAKLSENNTSAMVLALLKLNVFIRFQKKLGWTTATIDSALRAFIRPNVTALTLDNWGRTMHTALIYFSHLDDIATRTGYRATHEELLLLWSSLSTTGFSNLYERLFLSNSVLARDSVFEDPLGHYLQDSTKHLSDHIDSVTQALQITNQEIEQVFSQIGTPDPTLTIDNLTILVRHTVLAKALNMSVSNLLSYLALSGHAPMRDLSTEPVHQIEDDIPFSETIAFIQEVEIIQRSGLDIDMLEGLCRNQGKLIQTDVVAVLVERLLVALSVLPKLEPLPMDATPETTKKHEEAKQRDRLAVIQILSAQLNAPEALITTLITSILSDSITHHPLIESMTTRTEPLPSIGTIWVFYVWFSAAGSYKLSTSPTANPRLRFGIDGDTRDVENQNGNFELLQIQVGKRYRLELTLSTQDTMSIHGDAVPIGVPVEEYAKFAMATARLRKALDFLMILDISEAELKYMQSLSGATELNALPLSAVTDDKAAKIIFNTIWPWIEVASTRRYYNAGDRVVDVLLAANRTFDDPDKQDTFDLELNEALVALTGWKIEFIQVARDALTYTTTKNSINSLFVYEVPGIATGDRLRGFTDAITALVRLSLHPSDIIQWARESIDSAVATRIRAALKGRYPQSAWRELVRPIYDGLRKKQRDVLVTHLIHLPNAPYGETQEQLYEHLLIDSGTEPPVLASRIQLAISSIQLFIQRCLMSLEDDVIPSIIDAKRWQWMCRYRVWEVNRKMYIWAENWLDQEFRDDKTHLFRELEGTLLQGDVSDDLVRGALHTYLLGLQNIARLEMMAMYFEPGVSADGATVHVIGRTQHTPYKYFYRQCSHRMWTPWEPLDTEIEGEHLALTIWRGRLHLFWVTFFEKAEQNTSSSQKSFKAMGEATDSVSTFQANRAIQLQLNWVEQLQGKWVNRSSTQTFLDALYFMGKSASDPESRRQFSIHIKISTRETAELGDDILELHIVHASGVAQKFVMFSKLAPPKLEVNGSPSTPGPISGLIASASKWEGKSPLSVTFTSDVTRTDGVLTSSIRDTYHILKQGGDFKLLFPSNEIRLDINENIPRAAGNACGYIFAPQGAQHVVYRGIDSNIYDVWWTPNGWFLSEASAVADAEPATSDPHGYPLDEQAQHCIVYYSNKKVLELSWSQADSLGPDANSEVASGWQVETLYEAISETQVPMGRPLGGIFNPNRGVVYRTLDGNIFLVTQSGSPGSWTSLHLNPGSIPSAASDPAGLIMSETVNNVNTVLSRHIFYRGTDGHIHELKSDVAGIQWNHTNITAATGAPLSAADAQPGAYAFLAQKTLHVVYRDPDGVVQELWGPAGSWNHNAIGALYGKAEGDPTGYVTEGYGIQHVVYLGKDQQIHELWWSLAGWQENILTQAVKGAPKAGGNPVGYSFERQGTQHVVYRTQDGSLQELWWWGLDGWHLAHYELAKPTMDPIGPLISPFFYEDQTAPHTFFVEPSLAEKTIHDWEEYVVTTEEYVQQQPHIKYDLKPWFPEAELTKMVPSEFGIWAKDIRPRDDIFKDHVLLRTSKGLFGINGGVNDKTVKNAQAIVPQSAEIVDTTMGSVQLQVERAFSKLLRGGIK